MLPKNELVTRLELLMSDVNSKILQRPTFKEEQKKLNALDKLFNNKLEKLDAKLSTVTSQIWMTINRQDSELNSLNNELNSLAQDLHNKLTKVDGQRIWKHFQRFSEYDDLKDLYSKVIPEIAKFEEKIIYFGEDMERNKEIILQFDEHMS